VLASPIGTALVVGPAVATTTARVLKLRTSQRSRVAVPITD